MKQKSIEKEPSATRSVIVNIIKEKDWLGVPEEKLRNYANGDNILISDNEFTLDGFPTKMSLATLTGTDPQTGEVILNNGTKIDRKKSISIDACKKIAADARGFGIVAAQHAMKAKLKKTFISSLILCPVILATAFSSQYWASNGLSTFMWIAGIAATLAIVYLAFRINLILSPAIQFMERKFIIFCAYRKLLSELNIMPGKMQIDGDDVGIDFNKTEFFIREGGE